MGKRALEEFDESTKVHPSGTLDEMLKQASSREAEEVNRDFEDGDEHTRLAPSEELARALTASTPPPVMGRVATANIVRRSSAVHIAARASDQMPSVRALGSREIEAPARPPSSDDDAFDEWDAKADRGEPPSEKVTDELPRLAVEALAVKAADAGAPPPAASLDAEPIIEAPPAPVAAEPPTRPSVPSIPPINIPRIPRPTPMPMPVIEQPRGWPLRWGVIAWAALLAIAIGVGSVAYVKIHRLERELAQAKVQLQKEHAARK